MAISVNLILKINVLFCSSGVFAVIAGNDDVRIGELPFCNPSSLRKEDEIKKLVFVSTLDGKLSALDALSGGSLSWNVNTGQGPMLSSSIHRLELTNQGQWVRLIPSLSGGIYRFDGESIEAVPVTADNLLQSSGYLFSDNLVIAGGRETFTYGIDVRSGQLMYECSISNCKNYTDNIPDIDEVLVVQRLSQTVRAVEARSGTERWNFSVAQHDVKIVMNPNADCHDVKKQAHNPNFDFFLKIIVPEGLVCALSKSNPNNVVWKHKFDAPVVSAWQYKDGNMMEIDLFSDSHWQGEKIGIGSPTLYIGMHNKQLYIQESVTLQRRKAELEASVTTDDPELYPRIPWHPFPVKSTALGLPDNSDSRDVDHDNQLSTTTMSVLYGSSYVNGNGFYLYSDTNKHGQCHRNVSIVPVSNGEEDNDEIMEDETFFAEDTPAQIIIVSIWYYWKEVVVISFSTALLLNLLYRKVYIKELKVVVVEKPVIFTEDTDSGIERLSTRNHSDPGQLPVVPEFTSRYLTDFEPVRCLGKGGFGVVFEAKNKIDEWNYAVKRIALPNRQESRERVMREVRALAKLDHQHIVRYFNAWLECPPPGWQEQQDMMWPPSINTSCSLDDVASMDPVKQIQPIPLFEKSASSQFLNLRNTNKLDHSFHGPHLRNKGSKSNGLSLDISDSFIMFEASEEQEEAGDNRDSIITLNTNSSDNNSESRWKQHSSSNEMKQVVVKRPFSLDIPSEDGRVGKPVERMFLFIQMQLCREESLREWLKDHVASRITATVHNMFLQILDAVEYVHMQGLIHRDLKPSNIFFSLDGQIKVGDFGLVTAMVEGGCEQTPGADGKTFLADEKHTAQVGTQLYMSPEQSKGLPYNYKVDIYSLGVILFELLVPFHTEMERVTTLMKARNNKLPPQFQQQFKQEFDLLQMMLSHNPEERPTTYGIRARPPFNQQSATEWHFELPSRRRTSSTTHSSSSSTDSAVDQR